MAKNRLKNFLEKRKFPHFSRIINAIPLEIGVKLIMVAVLTLFLFINLFPGLPPDLLAVSEARLEVLLAPFNPQPHLGLASEYLKRGDFTGAEKEIRLAQDLTRDNPSFPVLGQTAISPLALLEKVKNEPNIIEREIAFWQEVITRKKDYRDAYLRLAVLNYQINQEEESRAFLQMALRLDPNFEPAKKLEEILKD
jgi:tetratricopeptide (TPR) repeat protein